MSSFSMTGTLGGGGGGPEEKEIIFKLEISAK